MVNDDFCLRSDCRIGPVHLDAWVYVWTVRPFALSDLCPFQLNLPSKGMGKAPIPLPLRLASVPRLWRWPEFGRAASRSIDAPIPTIATWSMFGGKKEEERCLFWGLFCRRGSFHFLFFIQMCRFFDRQGTRMRQPFGKYQKPSDVPILVCQGSATSYSH